MSSYWKKWLNKVVFLLFTSLMVLSCSLPVGPADDVRDGITLSEAKKLVPFDICFPTYLPDYIKQEPGLRYHAELGDSDESDIRIKYFDTSGENQLMIELYQTRYFMNSNHYMNDDNREIMMNRFLASWLFPDESVDKVLPNVSTKLTEYHEPRIIVLEMDGPEVENGILLTWFTPAEGYEKLYHLYTRLSLEEALKIAQSNLDCNRN